MLGFSPIFEVFSGLLTGLTYIIFGTVNRPNISKWPGAKFGKTSLDYFDLWHFSPPYKENILNLRDKIALLPFENLCLDCRRGRHVSKLHSQRLG